MNNRVKSLRKSLKFSQEAFGDHIGVTKATISRIEKGINNLTEQMIKSICREFNVNEEWLRNGIGDPRIETTDDTLSNLSKEYNFNNIEYRFLREYLNLDLNKRAAVAEFLESVLTGDSSFVATSERAIEKEVLKANHIEEEVGYYRQELQAVEKGATLSVLDKLGGA